MCGIAGIFAYSDLNKTWPEESLNSMVKRIIHRGPDGIGKHTEPGLFLGHSRLAVLDLSPMGRQPMFSVDKRFVISFNGEIYNFRELREDLVKKGYAFISNSDTEVLLSAWQEWGEKCLDKLDGIFAFALFDRDKKELFLVRDHLGIKPLFYTIDKNEIIFGSELPALFSFAASCPDVDLEDLDTYFTFNYLPAPRTGLKGAYQLPPGCLLKIDCNGQTMQHYWKPEYQVGLDPFSRRQVEYFHELLSTSIKSQMVSDAPLGLFLSGGLDSFAVAEAAVTSGQTPTAFTLGFDDRNFDESQAASIYAKYLHIPSEISAFSWTETEINETLGALGELLADASCFPIYQLSRSARRKVTVILAGDGGDELLAGYDTYKAGEFTHLIRMLPGVFKSAISAAARYLPSDNQRYGKRMIIERMLSAAKEGHRRDHASFRRIMDGDIKKRLYKKDFADEVHSFDPIDEYAGLMEEVPSERSYLTARQHADLIFHLPSILAKVDRMSMANGLEVRVPFLSKQMVEFCINLPDRAKRDKGKGKRILREAIAGKVPAGALSRPKAGFLPPVDRWFREQGPMRNVFGDYLNTAKSKVDFLEWREVDKLWDEHKQGKVEAGFILLGILQFINWRLKCRN